MVLKQPLQIFNSFWGDHHHWMFFGGLTIATNGFSMVFLFCYHHFQWFSMVPDHWSNDAMVSMDRCGLVWQLRWCTFRRENSYHKKRLHLKVLHHIPIAFSRKLRGKQSTTEHLTFERDFRHVWTLSRRIWKFAFHKKYSICEIQHAKGHSGKFVEIREGYVLGHPYVMSWDISMWHSQWLLNHNRSY